MTLIGLPESDNPREVWVSGTEIIRFVTELIDGADKEKRATGRTSRLACKYAELAMSYPHHRVVVKDHYDSIEADRQLLQMVQQILDTLRIDYEIGNIPQIVLDPGSFTGTTQTGTRLFIKATPRLIKKV